MRPLMPSSRPAAGPETPRTREPPRGAESAAASATGTSQDSATSPTTPPAAHRFRWVWLSAGILCVALAALGVALPLLPTTPFLILAAACFARGDERFLHWLLEHRVFGPTLRTWRARHALPPGVKSKAITLVVLTIGLSAWMLDHPVGRVSAFVVGAGLVVFLARLPVWDEESR